MPGILNRNIPNSLEYRERMLTEEEWNELVKKKEPTITENKFKKFLEEML